jgi:2-phospho-L-lactate guanylyltransferase
VEFIVAVPVKHLGIAKSRLRTTYGPDTEGLALAMALDVVAAASAAAPITGVAVITNDDRVAASVAALGARVLADMPDQGLNAALRRAAAMLRSEQPDRSLMVMPADCPSVRPTDFAQVAAALSVRPGRAFICDRAGVGTTCLAASPGLPLDPRYGRLSREEHLASGATELRGPRWRTMAADVDTPADLAAARRLGAGRRTTEWLDRHVG